MNVLAVIPARGGSKGIQNKNLRLVGGKTLVDWAVDAALDSGSINHIVVSSDSPEILERALALRVHGIRRPEGLATDTAPVAFTMEHVLHVLQTAGMLPFDVIVLLQPTSPFRTGHDIDNCVSLLANHPEADSVVSVVMVEDNHPARMYRKTHDDWAEPFDPEREDGMRQSLPRLYLRNGAIYACRSWLVWKRKVMGERKKLYVMSNEFSCNIDEERDLAWANYLAPLWAAKRTGAGRTIESGKAS